MGGGDGCGAPEIWEAVRSKEQWQETYPRPGVQEYVVDPMDWGMNGNEERQMKCRRVELLVFDGTNPLGWIIRVE